MEWVALSIFAIVLTIASLGFNLHQPTWAVVFTAIFLVSGWLTLIIAIKYISS